MPLSQGRINNMVLDILGDENVLDHAVRAQQVDAIQKQLGIGGNALTDGSCHVAPHSLIAVLQRSIIGLEQRYETLNQQCEIERVGGARTKDDALVADWHAILHAVVTNLRGQMPTEHSNLGLLDF